MLPRHPQPASRSRDNPVVSFNLDLVRSIYADWERGDFSRSDWADPEVEYVIADGPDPGIARGLADMARRAAEQLRPAKGTKLAAREIRELDGARVLVRVSARGRGKSSGIEVDYEQVQIFTFRAGKVTRLVVYYEPDRVFDELGLQSQNDAAQ
jgi:ketosteroid isomerase-like protein